MADLYLMLKDTPVLITNETMSVFEILNEALLPWHFKDSIKEVTVSESLEGAIKNTETFDTWLLWRELVLPRSQAEQLHHQYEALEDHSYAAKLQLVLPYKALSLSDNYWLTDNPDIKWLDINLHDNYSDEDLVQFTAEGDFSRIWRHDQYGALWFCKSSERAPIEVMCSNILDCCNVAHCHYEAGYDGNAYFAACPCMTSDKLSISDNDSMTMSYTKHLLGIDSDNLMRMHIVDYLLANSDRRSHHYGVYYKSDDMQILGMHPLTNHDFAFNEGVMIDEEYRSWLNFRSLKDNALMAMNHVNFHFTKEITRDMFLTDAQYMTFKHRATQLGIETHSLTRDDIYVQCGGFPKYKNEVLKLLPENIDDEKLIYRSMLYALQLVQGTHNCYR